MFLVGSGMIPANAVWGRSKWRCKIIPRLAVRKLVKTGWKPVMTSTVGTMKKCDVPEAK